MLFRSAEGTFLGVITARVAVPVLEDVTTRTIRSLQHHEGFAGAVEYQMLTKSGAVFVDSGSRIRETVNLLDMGLPSAKLSQRGDPGYVIEEHLRRHVQVVTGYAVTKGHGEFPGLGWTVLVRIDRDAILADRKSTRLNSSHSQQSRMPSSA